MLSDSLGLNTEVQEQRSIVLLGILGLKRGPRPKPSVLSDSFGLKNNVPVCDQIVFRLEKKSKDYIRLCDYAFLGVN